MVMGLWKSTSINDFRALRDLITLWEKSNTDGEELIDYSVNDLFGLSPKHCPHSNGKRSQDLPSLQTNCHIGAFLLKSVHNIERLTNQGVNPTIFL